MKNQVLRFVERLRSQSKIVVHFCTLTGVMITIFFAVAKIPAERLPLKIYSTADGLANDTVNRIVPDSRGFLWFCTAEGLSRFDGYRFKNYTQQEGLPHRNVHDLLEAEDGRYLIATSGGLVLFDPFGAPYPWNLTDQRLDAPEGGKPMFRTFLTPEAQADSKISKALIRLAKDKSGNMFSVAPGGVYRMRPDGSGWHFEKLESADWSGRAVNFNGAFGDSRGNLWIAESNGTFLRSPDGSITKVSGDGGNGFFETRDGVVWADSGGNPIGIRRFQFTVGEKYPKLVETLTQQDGLHISGFSNVIAETPDGRIFVSSDGRMFEYSPDAPPGQPRFRRLDDLLHSSATDKNSNIWFTAFGKGVGRYSPNGFSVYDERDGMPGDTITSIFGNRRGDVFMTVGRTKLAKFSNERIESLVPKGLVGRDWIETFLDFESVSGEFFVPSTKGLLKYPKVNGFAEFATTPPIKTYGPADGLKGSVVTSVFEDSRGDVWVGVADAEVTLHRIEKATGKVIQYGSADGLPVKSGAVAFGEDSTGSVWIGFYFGQIVRYRNGEFRDFTEQGKVVRSAVNGFLNDAQGGLWIATASRGLFRVDSPSSDAPEFVSFSTAQGLSSNQALCITRDRFGRIYVGTGRGINRIEPATGRVKIYTQDDGLPGGTIGKCYADSNGRIWFSSNSSLIRYTPTIENASTPPPIFIDEVSVNGRRRPISDLGEREITGMELSSTENQIRISFFAISFDSGESLRYQYKLNGQDWSEPYEQRSVDLNLSAGSYDFEVRSVTSDGVLSETSARVNFTIARPVWQRWWFILLTILLAGLIVFIIYRRRTQTLRRINAALTEARDAEEKLRRSREERLAELQKVRSRIATDLHDDIGSSLTQIAVFSEVARQREREDGNAGESLDLITNVANDLVDTMSDIVWAINPKKDHLQDLTQRMRRFAADVMTAKDIDLDFRAGGGDQALSLGANIRREVFLMFKETVNNIVKHSGATEARIDFKVQEKFLTLTMTDNGSGFDPSSKLSDESNHDWKKLRGGNGLINMVRRADELGGSYKVRSSPGNGTEVILTVPFDISDEEADAV